MNLNILDCDTGTTCAITIQMRKYFDAKMQFVINNIILQINNNSFRLKNFGLKNKRIKLHKI